MRKFYIIGHNPNTVPDAVKYLEQGANAIEPDIRYSEDKNIFFVAEEYPVYSAIAADPLAPSIEEYLNDLKLALKDNPNLDLSLIVFDIKDINYNINHLVNKIRINFTDEFPEMPIILTYGSPEGAQFLVNLGNMRENEAIGVDAGTAPEDVYNYFSRIPHIRNYIYSAGISLPKELWIDHFGVDLALGHPYKNVEEAVSIRNQQKINNIKFVYGWTINSEKWMRKYLDADADGLITDHPDLLRHLLNSDEYKNKFEPATRGDSPFKENRIV